MISSKVMSKTASIMWKSHRGTYRVEAMLDDIPDLGRCERVLKHVDMHQMGRRQRTEACNSLAVPSSVRRERLKCQTRQCNCQKQFRPPPCHLSPHQVLSQPLCLPPLRSVMFLHQSQHPYCEFEGLDLFGSKMLSLHWRARRQGLMLEMQATSSCKKSSLVFACL
jgi:hypothetical protein